MDFWPKFNEKHKNVGVIKENESKSLDYLSILKQLSPQKLEKLLQVGFWYFFLQFSTKLT